MIEASILQIFVQLGVPGVTIGVFLLLFRKLKFRLPMIPKSYSGPITIIFMVLVSGVALYTVTLWSPKGGTSKTPNSTVNENKRPSVLTGTGIGIPSGKSQAEQKRNAMLMAKAEALRSLSLSIKAEINSNLAFSGSRKVNDSIEIKTNEIITQARVTSHKEYTDGRIEIIMEVPWPNAQQ